MREFLGRCKAFFLYAGLFSFFINLLLLASPLYMMQLFDRVFGSRSSGTLLMLTIAVLGAYGIMAVLEMLRSRLMVRAGIALDRLMGEPLLNELLRNAAGPARNFYPHGLRDAATLRGFLAGRGVFAFFDAPWSPLFVIVIWMFHPLLGIVATVGILALFGLALIEEKITADVLEEARNRQRATGEFTDVAMRNAEVVHALGMRSAVTRRWEKLNAEALSLQALAASRLGTVGSWTKFVRYLVQTLMLATGAYLVIDLHVTPGIMLAATLILGRALAPIDMAIAGWRQMVEARSAYGRLSKLFAAMPQAQQDVELPAPTGRLTVERVTFARVPTQPILKGVSFELAPGESLGLIGPSAAGKSTLARILLGVWPPLSGAARLDGADISAWDRERLARYVGYLPQDVELFGGTVADNICRLEDPTACSEDIVRAAKRAGVHEMILRLPKGYDTDIGRAGVVFSGGQRQRIALARALYGEPRLVVLDEPNSNLDSEGEEALMQTMRTLKEEGVTLVVITHKPSLLAGIDKMLVLQNGAVEMFGPRQDVMARLTRAVPQTPVRQITTTG